MFGTIFGDDVALFKFDKLVCAWLGVGIGADTGVFVLVVLVAAAVLADDNRKEVAPGTNSTADFDGTNGAARAVNFGVEEEEEPARDAKEVGFVAAVDESEGEDVAASERRLIRLGCCGVDGAAAAAAAAAFAANDIPLTIGLAATDVDGDMVAAA